MLLASCASRPKLDTFGEVPPFELTDQSGNPFSSGRSLSGHVWVADFFFTNCPGPCPRMSTQMNQVQEALAASGIRIASITVDPDHDTPEVLAAYARRYKARDGVWYFLTGSQADLQHLSKDVFKLGDVDGSLEHSTRFALVDRASRIRGYYLSSEPDAVERLIADARGISDGP